MPLQVSMATQNQWDETTNMPPATSEAEQFIITEYPEFKSMHSNVIFHYLECSLII